MNLRQLDDGGRMLLEGLCDTVAHSLNWLETSTRQTTIMLMHILAEGNFLEFWTYRVMNSPTETRDIAKAMEMR